MPHIRDQGRFFYPELSRAEKERQAEAERRRRQQRAAKTIPPRNRLQCAARGCDGCTVCAPPASPAPGTP